MRRLRRRSSVKATRTEASGITGAEKYSSTNWLTLPDHPVLKIPMCEKLTVSNTIPTERISFRCED